MHNLFIGTSGYNYKHWRGAFYPSGIPQKNWLMYYAKYFNTVEINATFYRSFPRSVFENWYEKTPNKFYFSIKGPRFITHIKRLNNIQKETAIFLENIQGLKEKLSVILWQFPVSFRKNIDNNQRLESFLNLLPKGRRFVFEFRHQSWFNDEIYDLLNQYKAGFVINDTGAFATDEVITDNFVYVRFHGPASLYSSDYTEEQLKKWAKKIKKYLRKYDVYVYFNNDVKAYAVKNAKELKRLI